jgi:hypothetical protein
MTLYIPLLVYCQIKDFVELCDLEISGIGKISKYKDGFMIEKIKLLEQVVSSASTVLDARGLGKLYSEIIQEEGSLAGWKLWWHSHAAMPTFWSQTDNDTIKDFDNETPNNNWWLSAVFNHKMEWKARLDVFNPNHLTSNIDDLRIVQIYSRDIREDCRLQIEQKVKERVIRRDPPPVKIPLHLPLTKKIFQDLLPDIKKKSESYNSPPIVL